MMKRNFILKYGPLLIIVIAVLSTVIMMRPLKALFQGPRYAKPPVMIQKINAHGQAQQTNLTIELSSKPHYHFLQHDDKQQLQIRFKNTVYVMHQPFIEVAPAAVKKVTLKRHGRDTDMLVNVLAGTNIVGSQWHDDTRKLLITLESPKNHYFVAPKKSPSKKPSKLARTRKQYRYAQRLLRRGDVSAAIKQLKKLLITAPQFTPARLSLAEIYNEAGYLNSSIGVLKQGIRLQPQKRDYWMPLAGAYEKLDRTNDAINAYQQALRHSKVSPQEKARIRERLQVLESLRR